MTEDLTLSNNVFNISFSNNDQFNLVGKCVNHSFRTSMVAISYFAYQVGKPMSSHPWHTFGSGEHFFL